MRRDEQVALRVALRGLVEATERFRSLRNERDPDPFEEHQAWADLSASVEALRAIFASEDSEGVEP